MNNTISVLTPGFVRWKMFQKSMEHTYEKVGWTVQKKHWFLYQHYPINKAKNRANLEAVCKYYNIEFVDAGHDRGLHDGLNFLLERIGHNLSSAFIGHDPDECIVSKGWDSALVEACLGDSAIGFTCLSNFHNIAESGDCLFKGKNIAGHMVLLPQNRPTMFGVCAFKKEFIESTRGFNQPTSHYGHIESFLWHELVKRKMFYGILPEYKQVYNTFGITHNDAYTKYKLAQAAFQCKESLESWLLKNNPSALNDDSDD